MSWKFISHGKKHTQDGPNLVQLMKGIGRAQRAVRAVDIGCGDGIIASEIIKHHKATHVVAFDIDKESVLAAQENLKSEVARGITEVFKKSAQSFFKDRKNTERFDRVVINPPFFVEGSGPANKRDKDQSARHEKSLNMKTWVKGAARLLRTGGDLYCVFPTERLSELCCELSRQGLEPKELWWFKADLRKRRFFLRAMRSARPGLIIHFEN